MSPAAADRIRTMHRVDYDRVADLYDEPLRDHVADPELIEYVAGRSAGARPVRVLDAGCGTGKQIAASREPCPGAVLIGLDRFQGMLRIARARCRDAHWLQADAAALPLRDGSVDYVTSQFSHPHFRRTPQFIGEVFRALAPGGRFVMTNIDPWAMTRWLVYEYFPASLALDRKDFLPVDAFADEMRRAGFQAIRATRTDHTKPERLRDFLEYAESRHRASQLMAIPDAAYAEGLERLRRDLETWRRLAIPMSARDPSSWW
jgi:SAM-dependent methyltransferase